MLCLVVFIFLFFFFFFKQKTAYEMRISDWSSDVCSSDLAFARAHGVTVFHPVGSCRMGPDSRTSVVDPSLRVHGLEALRVADASIFPALPSGNTNAPAMMAGEKASDLILGRA